MIAAACSRERSESVVGLVSLPRHPAVAYLFLVRPMRAVVAMSILLTACTTTERTLPALPAATRVEVADSNQRHMRRITAPDRVAAIIALVDAQRAWHRPFLEKPVGSLQISFYSGSREVEFLDYGPGWLVRQFRQPPYYTALSRPDDDHLLRLLGIRREDVR
jgi:hypothetical protein